MCVCVLLLRFNKAMVSDDDKYRFTNTANREENHIGETIKFLKTLNGMNETNVQIIGNDTQLWLQFFFFTKIHLICFSINPGCFWRIRWILSNLFSWYKHKIATKLSVSKHWENTKSIQITAFGSQMFPI